MKISPRAEKIAIKDAKLRTFISSDIVRDDLVEHVYDVTYGQVRSTDNLVMIDDSIVRGTTLKNQFFEYWIGLILKKLLLFHLLHRLGIQIVMELIWRKWEDFIAFQAAVSLLKKKIRKQYFQKFMINANLKGGSKRRHEKLCSRCL